VAEFPPNFIIGQVYRRRELHDTYGGQGQGGISTPVRFPLIFLFTGESGHQYGYTDGYQPDGTFWYTGEGQRGDMQLKAGNLAIFKHQRNGKELHLFATAERSMVRYLGSAMYLGHHSESAPDRDGAPRRTIVFELAIDGGAEGKPLKIVSQRGEDNQFWSEPLNILRQRALQAPIFGSTPAERRTIVYQRSTAVRVYALRRAGGICEGCNQPAPFKRPDGRAYLEPHHIRRLADAGPDHPRWVAALCPNCHRRVHYGADGTTFNELLASRIAALEPP
jgi:5-methylcytosine-specific restriction enzyme A